MGRAHSGGLAMVRSSTVEDDGDSSVNWSPVFKKKSRTDGGPWRSLQKQACGRRKMVDGTGH
jgi:hypothetical protein